MDIVIDTNIFCEDYWMRGSNFRLFFDGIDSLPGMLKIPEVVVDEVVNRYRDDLEVAVAKNRDSRSVLARMLSKTEKLTPLILDATQEALRFRDWLEDTIKNHGEILPYPEISHKSVVERDLRRRKPFNRDGSGYRDFLIWESTRKLLLWGTERIVLITNNHKDFGTGPLVDADLQADILNPRQVKLFSGLRAFNEALIVPRLQMLDDVREALETGEAKADLVAWLRSNLLELLRDVDDIGPMIIGFPPGVGSVRPRQIIELHRLEVRDVRGLGSGEKLATLRVEADIEFSVDIDWDDMSHAEVRAWYGSVLEKFSSSWTYHVERLSVDLELTLNQEEVTSYELLEIDGPFGEIGLR